MADFSGATIEIGGEISVKHLSLLAKVAAGDGFHRKQKLTLTMARQCARRGEPLVLITLGARWGQFEMIEPFCQAHGLTYRRISERYYENDAHLVMWARGMKEPRECRFTNQAGRPAINLEDLKNARRSGRDLNAVIQSLAAYEMIIPPLVIKRASKNTRKLETSSEWLVGKRPCWFERWDDLRIEIGIALRHLAEKDRRYIVISYSEPHRFVQFASSPNGGVKAEAIGNYYLDDNEKLPSSTCRALVKLGWKGPRKKGNFWRRWRSPVPFQELVALAVTTLRDTFKVTSPADLNIERAEFPPAKKLNSQKKKTP
jgi:hypothetical protein